MRISWATWTVLTQILCLADWNSFVDVLWDLIYVIEMMREGQAESTTTELPAINLVVETPFSCRWDWNVLSQATRILKTETMTTEQWSDAQWMQSASLSLPRWLPYLHSCEASVKSRRKIGYGRRCSAGRRPV